MPFGFKNAPRFFQAIMCSILCPILGTGAQVFIDDIIIYGDTWPDFLPNLRMTLSLLDPSEAEKMHVWPLRGQLPRLCRQWDWLTSF
jgi:hypothetical protein